MLTAIKSIFKRKIQREYIIAIPKDIYENNSIKAEQNIEIIIGDKGDTLETSGLFIRFLAEEKP